MFLRKDIVPFIAIIILLFSILVVTGCGVGTKKGSIDEHAADELVMQAKEEPFSSEGEATDFYIVIDMNLKSKTMILQNTKSNRQEEYSYTGGTYILDKYGSNLTIAQLNLGEIVSVEMTGKDNKLSRIQLPATIVSQDNVSKYTMNQEEHKLTIGNTDYYYDDTLFVISQNEPRDISELSEQDIISIRGEGKKLYSIIVTAGHGTIILKDTQLFEGGFVTIGNVLAEKITANMSIEIAEGTYLLSVTKDGYSGSVEITVIRDEELVVDLEAIEGEAPKDCTLQFRVVPEYANVTLGGVEIEPAQPINIKYGIYTVTAKAEGYEDWTKKVAVNSSEATISIELKPIETTEETLPVSSGTTVTPGNTTP
ncbi:PEGA domain-containing protein [Lachnospiraceae bacterium ZAX-1]